MHRQLEAKLVRTSSSVAASLLPILIACVILAGATASGRATVVAYEGFNYTGTALGGQSGGGDSGFAEAWVDNTPFTPLSGDATSLNSAAFPFTPIGARVQHAQNGSGLHVSKREASSALDVDAASTQTWYISALMRQDVDNGPSSDSASIGLGPTSATDNQAPLLQFGMGSNQQFFISAFGSGSTSTGAYSVGSTYFLVAQITAGTSGEEIRMVAYGPSDTVPTAEPNWAALSNEATSVTGTDLNTLILNYAFNFTGGIDEIRIGTAWSSVTISALAIPEPSTAIFVAGGLFMAFLRRNRLFR